jgi:hypothetical protein
MIAEYDLVAPSRCFAIKIKAIPLSVRSPNFLKGPSRFGGGDTESGERQDQSADTDVRRRARVCVAALPTPENRRTDVSLGPNSLKHRIQIVPQLDDCLERHALMPL